MIIIERALKRMKCYGFLLLFVLLFAASSVLSKIETSRWAVQVAKNEDPDKVASEHGFVNVGKVAGMDGFFLFRQKPGRDSTEKSVSVDGKKVLWAEKQDIRRMHPRYMREPEK